MFDCVAPSNHPSKYLNMQKTNHMETIWNIHVATILFCVFRASRKVYYHKWDWNTVKSKHDNSSNTTHISIKTKYIIQFSQAYNYELTRKYIHRIKFVPASWECNFVKGHNNSWNLFLFCFVLFLRFLFLFFYLLISVSPLCLEHQLRLTVIFIFQF